MASIPKPYLVVYLTLSILLNILGVASIVGGVISWVGFLAELIGTYHRYLRDPILHIVMFVWPSEWPRIPSWAIDLIIVKVAPTVETVIVDIIKEPAPGVMVVTEFEATGIRGPNANPEQPEESRGAAPPESGER